MAHRVTIMLDEDVYKKLRKLQAKQIRSSSQNKSLSRLVNDVLKQRLEK